MNWGEVRGWGRERGVRSVESFVSRPVCYCGVSCEPPSDWRCDLLRGEVGQQNILPATVQQGSFLSFLTDWEWPQWFS